MTEDTVGLTDAPDQDPSRPPWLPPGATLNPDGSVTLVDGRVIPAPPTGWSRDPQTGMEINNGFDPGTGQVTGPTAPYPGFPATNPGANGAPTKPPGPSAPAGPGGYQPWNTPYTAPPQLDLGGQKGLAFIPPPPQFDFKPPSIDDAMNEPGYQFGFNEGKRALETSAAAKGLTGSSGTLLALEDYGRNAATQNYGNVYNRAFTLAGAKFAPLLSEWGTLGQAGQRQDELQQSRAWDAYKQHYAEYFDWNNQDWARKYGAYTAQ